MKVILFFLILTSNLAYSQKLNPPSWDKDYVEFVSAKLKVYDGNNKLISDSYKDATIKFESATILPTNFTINVPDRFFLKDGVLDSYQFERKDEGYSKSYTVISGNKMAAIRFEYSNLSTDDNPRAIVVIATDNYTKQPIKKVNLALYEFKN